MPERLVCFLAVIPRGRDALAIVDIEIQP